MTGWNSGLTPLIHKLMRRRTPDVDAQSLEKIRSELNELLERTGDIFVLHRAGRGYKDLAADFKLSESTVEKRIARAVLWLMDQGPDGTRMIRIAHESARQEGRIRAEAASWFARRHGSDRSAATEEEWSLWLSKDPDHAAQFKIAASVWNDPGQYLRKSTRRRIERPVLVTFTAILVLAAAGGVIGYLQPITLSTGRGERLSQTLADGTQVELNTDTQIAVRYGARQREIALQSGEIYLNVIKHEPRPFVVVAGDRKVVAMGTSFVVHRDDSSATPLTVIVIEGRVMIWPAGTRDSSQTPGNSQAIVLNAGERARFRHDGSPIVDKPPVGRVTSWKEGVLTFSDTPLAEAVQQFNRYSTIRFAVGSSEVGSIPINGVYWTEDVLSFLRIVTRAQHLKLQVQGDDLILEPVRSAGSGEKENPAH